MIVDVLNILLNFRWRWSLFLLYLPIFWNVVAIKEDGLDFIWDWIDAIDRAVWRIRNTLLRAWIFTIVCITPFTSSVETFLINNDIITGFIRLLNSNLSAFEKYLRWIRLIFFSDSVLRPSSSSLILNLFPLIVDYQALSNFNFLFTF